MKLLDKTIDYFTEEPHLSRLNIKCIDIDYTATPKTVKFSAMVTFNDEVSYKGTIEEILSLLIEKEIEYYQNQRLKKINRILNDE